MITAIVDYLTENYPAYTFARYGSDGLPCPPYGVVKPEKGINGRNVRIILHNVKGSEAQLESDLRMVVSLLENHEFTSSAGSINRLGRMVDYTDVTAVSDDSTISMEALFLMPTTSF